MLFRSDGIGATEMLHIFIGSPEHEIRPGATGRPVPGYEACILDDDGHVAPPNTVGRLAVRGPTGCRYLADARQAKYVQDGWNVTGDTYLMDADGYFWYQARSDDMIISAGYNIAGPEVEAALDKSASMKAVGNLNEFVKYQMAKGFEGGQGAGGAGDRAVPLYGEGAAGRSAAVGPPRTARPCGVRADRHPARLDAAGPGHRPTHPYRQ